MTDWMDEGPSIRVDPAAREADLLQRHFPLLPLRRFTGKLQHGFTPAEVIELRRLTAYLPRMVHYAFSRPSHPDAWDDVVAGELDVFFSATLGASLDFEDTDAWEAFGTVRSGWAKVLAHAFRVIESHHGDAVLTWFYRAMADVEDGRFRTQFDVPTNVAWDQLEASTATAVSKARTRHKWCQLREGHGLPHSKTDFDRWVRGGKESGPLVPGIDKPSRDTFRIAFAILDEAGITVPEMESAAPG